MTLRSACMLWFKQRFALAGWVCVGHDAGFGVTVGWVSNRCVGLQ